jgi:sensor domain CHASE-containing protein
MERLRDAVLNDIATLGEVASDYAAWDATVGFMTGENPNYIQENLSGETFGNLRIHLALFLKLDGTVVWSRFMNAESDREMPLPEELKRELHADSKLLAHAKNDTLVSGLLGLSDSSIMLASYPVVHNDRSGQMYGVVILGRLFSRAEASRLAELTHIPFNIGTSWPTAPEDAVISQSATIIVRPVDRKSLDAQCLMRDVNGQPALSLQTTLPRAIHAKGQILVTYMMVVLACIVVVFGVLIAVLMERHLIKPITSLSADAVLSLGAGGTHGEANERAGNELATLVAIVDNAKVFRKLLMNSSDIICVLDRNGRIKYVSRSVERVLGWPRETLLSRSFFDILHPDDVERAAKDFQQLLRGDLLGELQFSIRRGICIPCGFFNEHAERSRRGRIDA